jgi:hypothetical protein
MAGPIERGSDTPPSEPNEKKGVFNEGEKGFNQHVVCCNLPEDNQSQSICSSLEDHIGKA